MDKTNEASKALDDATFLIESKRVNLLSEPDVQKAILKNLIEIKYLLRQITRNDAGRK